MPVVGGRDAEEFAKPVVAIVPVTRQVRGEVLFGTAFPIGGPFFLTAAHVVENIRAAGGEPFVGLAAAAVRFGPAGEW